MDLLWDSFSLSSNGDCFGSHKIDFITTAILSSYKYIFVVVCVCMPIILNLTKILWHFFSSKFCVLINQLFSPHASVHPISDTHILAFAAAMNFPFKQIYRNIDTHTLHIGKSCSSSTAMAKVGCLSSITT